MNNLFKRKTRGFERISDKQKRADVVTPMKIKLPKRGTKHSAGYDFFAPYDITLNPYDSVKIPTGIRAYMKKDEVLKIHLRSSIGFNNNVILANTVGIVDSDYYNSKNEGHIWVKLRNNSNKKIVIIQGTAFCQGVFQKYLLADGDDFDSGETRNGGIGSTNSK